MEQNKHYGFALPVTVFALVVVGVITTGGFFMANQEGRIGVASEHADLAFYLTERGLVDLMSNWKTTVFEELPLWGDTALTQNYSGLGQVTTRITRMTEFLYFLDVDATVTKGGAMLSGASRRVGLTVRLVAAEMEPRAALTTRGQTTLQGTAEVHGEDEVPGGWGPVCLESLEDKPGILTDDDDDVTTQGAAEITGAPAVEEDESINDATFTEFGALNWNDLISMADITLSGGSLSTTGPDSTAAGLCRSGSAFPSNWGNPENAGAACSDWFPIIHVAGNATIQSGGVGQGVLLVDGDLDLRGNFAFYGIIIVQGNMSTQGQGNRIWGGVLASNADFDTQALTGGSVVTNSTCAVRRAVKESLSLTRVRPLVARSWVDLSAISES
jgi:hypothetical protein